MIEDLNPVVIPTVVDQLVADEVARREDAFNTSFISVQPFMDIRFEGENCRGRSVRITALGEGVPIIPAVACVACSTVRDAVVAWAEQLEVIHVIQDRNSVGLQFPEDGWREVMIDVADMRNIGPKFGDHCAQAPPRRTGINGVGGEVKPVQGSSRCILEVDMGHEVPLVHGGGAAFIRHREKRGLVAVNTQKLHQFEQVNLGTAERKVIFVAKQDSHG